MGVSIPSHTTNTNSKLPPSTNPTLHLLSPIHNRIPHPPLTNQETLPRFSPSFFPPPNICSTFFNTPSCSCPAGLLSLCTFPSPPRPVWKLSYCPLFSAISGITSVSPGAMEVFFGLKLGESMLPAPPRYSHVLASRASVGCDLEALSYQQGVS